MLVLFVCVFTVLQVAVRIPVKIGVSLLCHSQDALRIHIAAKRASSELAAHGSCYATLGEMANSDYVRDDVMVALSPSPSLLYFLHLCFLIF